jgi:hypothetical protein
VLPCSHDEATDGDEDAGGGEVEVHACAAPFGVASDLAEVVAPGVRALDHPPPAVLDGSLDTLGRDVRGEFVRVDDVVGDGVVVAGV